MAAGGKILSVEFEIFGKVQGVFFRKHTQKTASGLGLVGWVKNTRHDTVLGHMQGTPDKITEMKHWLMTKGSPKSRIARAEFRNEKTLDKKTMEGFVVKK